MPLQSLPNARGLRIHQLWDPKIEAQIAHITLIKHLIVKYVFILCVCLQFSFQAPSAAIELYNFSLTHPSPSCASECKMHFICTVTIFTCTHAMVFNWFVHAMFSHLKLFWQAFETARKKTPTSTAVAAAATKTSSVSTINHIIEILIVNHLQRSTHWFERSIHTFWFYYFPSHHRFEYELPHSQTRTTLKHFQNVRNKPLLFSSHHFTFGVQHLNVHWVPDYLVTLILREKWLCHSDGRH